MTQKKNEPTRRGTPADYDGSNPFLCNASTQSGKPCRAPGKLKGRCMVHLGMKAPPAKKDGVVIRRSRALREKLQFQQYVDRVLGRLRPKNDR